MTLTDTVTRTTASRTRSLLPGLLCAALSLGAWQAATAATAQDTLIIGKPADPQTLDPAVTFDNNDWTITYPSYQRLVGYKTDGEKAAPKSRVTWPKAGLCRRTTWSGSSSSKPATSSMTAPKSTPTPSSFPSIA